MHVYICDPPYQHNALTSNFELRQQLHTTIFELLLLKSLACVVMENSGYLNAHNKVSNKKKLNEHYYDIVHCIQQNSPYNL